MRQLNFYFLKDSPYQFNIDFKLLHSCPTLFTLADSRLPNSSVHGDSSFRQETQVGCLVLLQGLSDPNYHFFTFPASASRFFTTSATLSILNNQKGLLYSTPLGTLFNIVEQWFERVWGDEYMYMCVWVQFLVTKKLS